MNEIKRWIEIQFYLICADTLKIKNDTNDVFTLTEALARIGHFDIEKTKLLAQEVLTSTRYRPDRYELIILSNKFNSHKESLKKRIRICNRDYYNILEKDKQEPRPFFPRMLQAQLDIAEKFVDTYYKIKGVGLGCYKK